jgi:hypothetical protein
VGDSHFHQGPGTGCAIGPLHGLGARGRRRPASQQPPVTGNGGGPVP